MKGMPLILSTLKNKNPVATTKANKIIISIIAPSKFPSPNAIIVHNQLSISVIA